MDLATSGVRSPEPTPTATPAPVPPPRAPDGKGARLFLANLFPWVLPLLAAVPMAWKARRDKPALGLALGWVFGMLVLLSASRVKQDKYLLPLLPAAALLAGWAVEECVGLKKWTARITMGVLALLAGALAGCAWLLPEHRAVCVGLALLLGALCHLPFSGLYCAV